MDHTTRTNAKAKHPQRKPAKRLAPVANKGIVQYLDRRRQGNKVREIHAVPVPARSDGVQQPDLVSIAEEDSASSVHINVFNNYNFIGGAGMDIVSQIQQMQQNMQEQLMQQARHPPHNRAELLTMASSSSNSGGAAMAAAAATTRANKQRGGSSTSVDDRRHRSIVISCDSEASSSGDEFEEPQQQQRQQQRQQQQRHQQHNASPQSVLSEILAKPWHVAPQMHRSSGLESRSMTLDALFGNECAGADFHGYIGVTSFRCEDDKSPPDLPHEKGLAAITCIGRIRFLNTKEKKCSLKKLRTLGFKTIKLLVTTSTDYVLCYDIKKALTLRFSKACQSQTLWKGEGSKSARKPGEDANRCVVFLTYRLSRTHLSQVGLCLM